MKWIWINNDNEKDAFAEFELPFCFHGKKVELSISADYKYFALIEEQMVSCGQYSDLPYYKSVNKTDITNFVKSGSNTLRVFAWHMGKDFSVCRTMPASIAFEITVDGNVVARSDENTLCRRAKGYLKGDMITPQLGMGFNYDFTSSADKWQKAVEIQTNFDEIERPVKQTTVGEVCISKIASQGIFKYRSGTNAAEKMQNAWLCTLQIENMTGKSDISNIGLDAPISFSADDGDGIFVIADMTRESCGHLSFTVTVDKDCKMLLGWGEHLTDMRVRTKIDMRNFGMEITLKKGENVFDDYFLRLGCRYICIFAETGDITLSRLGIREVGYPFSFPKKDFGNSFLNTIYETGRRTLYLSAHEHYEDCPWREQALYGMDSRNQMLFGYGAFEEYEYPRANLMLIAKSVQENGLIPLTAPAESIITIPSFTAYWIIAIGENAELDYNEEFIKSILPYAEKGLDALLLKETENGISLFTETYGWNFHEWSQGLDGGEIVRKYEIEPEGDALLTALTAAAVEKMSFLYKKLGEISKAKELEKTHARLIEAIEKYYDSDRGVYASYIKDGARHGYHEFTQAVILCAGAAPIERQKAVCDTLKAPEKYDLVPSTLASLQFKYEALMKYGDATDFCLKETERIFGNMLFKGATSYWETEKGEADFSNAGSLCHGWSAVCCWLLDNQKKWQKR